MRTPGISAAAFLAAAIAAGCEGRARPWDQGDADAPPPRRAPRAAFPSLLSDHAGEAPGDSADGGLSSTNSTNSTNSDEPPSPATPPVRVGGPWVRCYGNFRPSGEPEKDVTRLSLLCGPENGMRRLSKQPLTGEVIEGGASVSQPLEARRGECYRVFAVAEPTVTDLDVTVESSRGAPVAADHGEDSWPIVQPDRPFCPLADDRFTVEIAARHGRGRFAAEIWALRSPRAEAATKRLH